MLLTDHLVEVRAILTHHNHSSVYAQYITFAMSWAVHWSIWIWIIMFCYIIPFRGVPLLQCHLNVYSCMSLLSFIHFFYITLFKAPSNDLKSLTVTSAANLGSIKQSSLNVSFKRWVFDRVPLIALTVCYTQHKTFGLKEIILNHGGFVTLQCTICFPAAIVQ